MTSTPEIVPGLARDIEAIDCSGRPECCHIEAGDDLVERFCAALDEPRDVIPSDSPNHCR